MSWATTYINDLKNGKTVSFRPHGGSMAGRIESGDLCVVEPIGKRILKVGDVVLCNVNGSQYLHLIKGINGQQYQIGNNRGRINGWIEAGNIYGVCVKIEGIAV